MKARLDHKHIEGTVSDFTCGYCFQRTGYNILYADRSEIVGNYGDFITGRAITVLECRGCRMLNLVTLVLVQETNEYPTSVHPDLEIYLIENPQVLDLYYDEFDKTIQPVWMEVMGQYPAGIKFSAKIPEEIQQDLKEAANCLAVEAPNATLLLCRKVLERIAIHCGVIPRGHTLGLMIKELDERELISQEYIIAFREINQWGNIGAHVKDEYERIELDEAREVLHQVLTLVDRYFDQPEIDKIKRLRENKKTR